MNIRSLMGLFLGAAVVALSLEANAAKYLVVYKTNVGFQQGYKNFSSRYGMSDFRTGRGHYRLGKLEGLYAMNSIVLNNPTSADLSTVQNDPNVALIEAEYYHPAPRPIRGYKLTRVMPSMRLMDNTPPNMAGFPGANTPWGILAVHAPQAWNTAHFGAGARVAVLDTGIDKDHPAVRAALEQGQDFCDDNNTPYEFADHVGHGTHVSGTIAGSMLPGGFSGVAPQAKILMGRVCATEGCSNIAIARGIAWAVEQKVDVISMSLGGDMITKAEKVAVASAEQAGVVVVAAAGNDGSAHVSYPAALPTVISVGAVASDLTHASFSQWGPELKISAPGVGVLSSVPQGTARVAHVQLFINNQWADAPSTHFQGSADTTSELKGEVVYAGFGAAADFAKVDVHGKIVLVDRGNQIRFSDKVQGALQGGAIAVLIANNEPGLFQGGLTNDPNQTVPIPVFLIEQAKGQIVNQSLQAGQKVGADMNVVAADYDAWDGTSMATPHVSGVVALVKATNHNLTPAQVRSIITSTAQPLQPNTQNQFGAGLVNAEAAVNAAAGGAQGRR